jgi:integrase
LGEIKQFKKLAENYNHSTQNIHFRIKSSTVNLEAKYFWYHELFYAEKALVTIFVGQCWSVFTKFLNEKYPTLFSLLDLGIDKVEREWLFRLHEQKYKTQEIQKHAFRAEVTRKTHLAGYLRLFLSKFLQLTDTREEWEKDRWDVRILHDKYGIHYNKSNSAHYLDFTKIERFNMRLQIKKYIKLRLLSKHNFTWASAIAYMSFLPNFLSCVSSMEPNWNDLRGLKRTHMEIYIQWLHEYAKGSIKHRNTHSERYINKGVLIVGKFLEDLHRYEYDIAPETPIQKLLFPEDKPKLRKKSIDQIDYIPDYVLEQLFTHINDLPKDITPIVWVAFKTGLRISDVLGLTSDCLVKLNGKYSIITDIEKTYVKGHRIPIDEQLANILAVLIRQSKERSNQDNNPEGLIFVRYRGIRKGRPFNQHWLLGQLNELAMKKNITDENGSVSHFKTHQFRHTYAVKLLNGGADILTVQELLAHASPEMTLRYAKLLDDTKRKAFETVITQGVFSFDLNDDVQEIKVGEDIPAEILHALWQDHKLNAMDNPYGTCHARLKGECPQMEAPPCLTCNGGSPCKDLAIGFSELDVEKYELHIKTTSKAIEVSKQHGREDIAEKHEKNLLRYQGILTNLQEGNIIFGRQDRVKRKVSAGNG